MDNMTGAEKAKRSEIDICTSIYTYLLISDLLLIDFI